MKTNKLQFCRAAKVLLRISLLVLVCLQISVLTVLAGNQGNKVDVRVYWGTDTNWSGDGGTVESSGKLMQTGKKISPQPNDKDTLTFTITPDTGYVINSVKWKSGGNDSFSSGGTTLNPNSSNQVSFTLTGSDAALEILFKLDPNTAHDKITAYYGSNAFDFTSANMPDWIGGTVSINSAVNNSGTTYTSIGSSSYTLFDFGNSTSKKFKITPSISPDFSIVSIKYTEVTWSDPRTMTQVGIWNTLTYDSSGVYTMTGLDPAKTYAIFVKFAPVGAQGGYIGAWYGTNNTGPSPVYDTPNANGSGGTVWATSPAPTVQFVNRAVNGVHVTSNGNVTIDVRPATGFKISTIQYGGVSPINSVVVPANQTTNMTFTLPVSGGSMYIVWVVFTSTAASSYTVTGTVDPLTDILCTSNSINPPTTTVNNPNTGTSFVLSTSTNCVIDQVNFDAKGYSTTGISGTTYTTPAITKDTNFIVRFKPVGYTIDASVDASSPTGSGGITPTGPPAIPVAQASSQSFIINVNTGYSISHVYVTDANKSWTNHDLAPMTGNTYTFTDIHANGSIKVYFVASVPVSGYDYCQIPPFVQGKSDLVPNVLIVFDNSGSMGGNDTDGYAYLNRPGNSYSCTTLHNATNPCPTPYNGYFDPYKMYKTQTSPSNANVYLISNVTLDMSDKSANGLSGNYLNYQNMNKVDIIRKILVGGRVTDKGSSTLTRTSATKYLYTDNGKWVEYGTTEPVGLIQEYSNRIRFGLEVFGSTSNANSDGGTIVAQLGSSVATIVTAIEGPKTDPKTNTPIAEALYEAIRYFQAKPSAYNSNTNYGDATWNSSTNPIIQYRCQKQFVLLLTDGEANSTDKLPGLTNPSMNGYTDSVFNVKTWAGRILSADLPSTSDGKYSDAVAYYAHVTDLRSTDFGNDIEGIQNITFYTVYAFGDGSGRQTLQMLSKYGGFDSKNKNDAGTDPKYPSPDLPEEWQSKDDAAKPATYFEGSSAELIGAQLIEAFKQILANVSSGTAASILANSEGSGANLLQAIFYPNKLYPASTEADWTGELHNLWYFIDPFVTNSTVREDTDYPSTGGTHYLNLMSDYVVNYYFDSENSKTMVRLDKDLDGNGSGETAYKTGVEPDDVKSIWRAGKILWARDASDRKIYTPCSLKNGACLACLGAAGCPSGSTNSGMMAFNTDNKSIFGYYLQALSDAAAGIIIDYVRGVDQDNYRSRVVAVDTPDKGVAAVTKVWKLGDIISSTPRIESSMKINTYDLPQPSGYGDESYGNVKGDRGFINTPGYKNRGMVFAGANDGMLHAFNLGILDVTTNGDRRASLSGTDLGKEAWAFIPSSALPYLKYMGDMAYGDKFHVNYVDGTTIVSDVSIGISAGCTETTDYWKCNKDIVNGTNWRTIVIGSMGTGGATRIKGTTTCSNCVNTPILDPKDNTKGFGYSSYFALDVTDPVNPTLLWEFSDPAMGFATSGPAIVKLATTDSSGNADINKNGRWFAVFASGPTGPISLTQFHGRSNQPLKLFIRDLKTGADMGTIDKLADGTTLDNAFAGSIFNNVIDTDRGTPASAGFYQDDVVYMGYSQANGVITDAATTWTKGGLLRLVTGEKLNANGTINTTAGWKLSKVIDGIGPVGSNIGKIVDKKNKNLWLYFGTGRFFDTGDDKNGQQRLYGIKEPCYKTSVTHADGSVTKNDIDDNGCTTTLSVSTDLDDQTSTPSLTLNAIANKGWYINLDLQTDTSDAERVLTDPVTTLNGVVFFTTFKPASDVCSFGGSTNIWATSYDSGAAPPAGRLEGKALIQLSTGSFTSIDLKDAFGAKEGRMTTNPLVGKPPGDAMPLISSSQNRPVKRIMHIREK